MYTLAQLEAAANIVYQQMQATPQYVWPLLSNALGCELWLKHENHTPTGAFKLRGGMVYFEHLKRLESQTSKLQGVVSATRGNHGQSIARAAAAQGMRSVIVVPKGNSREKNAAMQAFGAELVEHGDDFQAAREHAEQLAKAQGLHMVPSFHEHLVTGVASYALELLRAVPDLDVLYVPIGMGSGCCGCIAARDALQHKARIVAVTSTGARGYKLSLDAGRCIESAVTTQLADGMAVRMPHPDALKMIAGGIDRVVEVSDAEVAEAMRLIYRCTHNVAEGAGAAALAAAMQEKALLKGKKVAAILCGGNVDSDVLASVLNGASA